MSHGISRIPLAWGSLTAEFEPDTGWLRQVMQGERLLVRAFYAAVRHEDWSTPLPEIWITRHWQREGSCELEWIQRYPHLDFTWKGVFKGCRDGSCMISGEGLGSQTFQTRRTGLCLLHPSEQKGLPVKAIRPDGCQTEGAFPHHIAPHQPFFDIAGLEVDSIGRFNFEGEIFEMEDQRNWSDASFKTYCRPHTWPSPYAVEAGKPIRQRITFAPQGHKEALPLLTRRGAFPKLGVWVRPEDELPDWKGPRFADLIQDDWREAHLAAQEPSQLYVAWEPGRLIPPCAGVLTHPDHESAARAAFGETPVFAWHGGNFTELNRAQPLSPTLDGLAFRVCCQVHTEDDASVLENTLALTDVMESAAGLAEGRPVIVAPLQFGLVRHGADHRKRATMVGNQWTLLSLLHLGLAGCPLVFAHDSGEFPWGDMGAMMSLAEMEGRAIELLPGSVPGRVMGFKAGDERILFNLTPERLEGLGESLTAYEVTRART